MVVDTHVLLASLLGGEARLVMRYWWEGKVALVLSEEMVEEYLAALARVGDTKAGARELMEAFGGGAPGRSGKGKVVWVEGEHRLGACATGRDRPQGTGADAPAAQGEERGEGTPLRQGFVGQVPVLQRGAVLRPALNKFVEAAVAGEAEAIVALDPELVERGGWKGIPILTPGAWLEETAADRRG